MKLNPKRWSLFLKRITVLNNIVILLPVICFLTAFLKKEKDIYLKCALFFTLCADYCIIIASNNLAGVAIFCIAHGFYIMRNTNRIKAIAVFYAVTASLAFAVYLITKNVLIALSALYACCLMTNAVTAVFMKNKMIIAGTVLFLFCDVCVLFYNGDAIGINFPEVVLNRLHILIWLFYTPSQVLLALSLKKRKDRP